MQIRSYKTVFLGTALILFFCAHLKAQDPQFSQFYAAPLYLSPALAGAETSINFNVNYRTQWRSVDSPYNLGQFSMIYPVILNASTRKHLGGIGVSAYNETAGLNGSLSTTGAFLSAAYNLDLDISSLNRITFGVQGGMIQKQIDFNTFQWGSQYDELLGFQPGSPQPDFVNQLESNALYPVFNAGIMWFLNPNRFYSGSNAYGGISASNLNQPNESLIIGQNVSLPILYKAVAGLQAYVSPEFSIAPNGIFLLQGDAQQINLGTYFTYNLGGLEGDPSVVQLGVWHRVGDAFILSVGFASKNLVIGASFDYNSSALRLDTRGQGAYEISLSYKILKSKELKRFSTPLI